MSVTDDYRGSPSSGSGILFGAGARSRNLRTVAIAAVILLSVWTIRSSPLFRSHYESGFSLVNPDKPPPQTRPSPPKPVPPPAGDNFYVTDALHHALNPPPAPAPANDMPPFPDNAAVIAAPDITTTPTLIPLILHFSAVLGPAWPIVLLTRPPPHWVEPGSPALRRLMRAGLVRIHFFPSESTDAAAWLTRPWFWERLASARRVLLFDADSMLCSGADARVDDFAQWALVGAPGDGDDDAPLRGGLSLRDPRAMLRIVRDPAANDFERLAVERKALLAAAAGEQQDEEEAARTRARIEAQVPAWQREEDLWFYHKLREEEDRAVAGGAERRRLLLLPDGETAKRFAVEAVWFDRPLGFHRPFKWLTEAQRKQAVEWCPELALVRGGVSG